MVDVLHQVIPTGNQSTNKGEQKSDRLGDLLMLVVGWQTRCTDQSTGHFLHNTFKASL